MMYQVTRTMYKKISITILFIVLLNTSFLIHPTKTFADFRIGVFPPIMQIQATVPVAIRKDITLVNASDTTTTLDVVWKMFEQGPYNNGQVQYSTNKQIEPDKNIFQKIQLLDDQDNPVTSVTLGPKQKKTFTIHIGLPKDEPGADYYFSLLFIGKGQQTTQNGSSITAGIATNILLSIGPKDKTQGLLDEFSAPWFVQTGPVPFTVLVSNLSRHFINPTGQIYIRNMFGQLVGRVDLLPVNVLGQSSRYLPTKNNPDSFGHPVALWDEKVLFGPYRANIVVALANDGPILTKTVYFFAMPIQYLIGLFLAIIILSIILSRVKRKMKED